MVLDSFDLNNHGDTDMLYVKLAGVDGAFLDAAMWGSTVRRGGKT